MKLLRDTSPQLRSEWDSANNGDLSFDNVRSGAKQKAHWICAKNPLHRWEAQIRDRSMGHGCPYCSGRLFLKEESFGSLHPGLLKQWDSVRNVGIDPFGIGPLNKMRIWWRCGKCQHSWATQLRARTKKDAGCPNCRIAANSLASAAPEIAQQWHPEKNGSKVPENVAVGSRYIAW
ncbi:MAG: zinc-ribbon domain-containing protein [Prosthecobacter sp.]|uniref:zinc-ribbon domain-containing protein n=1 Tax=Prosthecobacter sp. TaxID=1965333 RepID=UPI0019F0BE14|nr:zinc-ribbon domain-containing protein [Prosthecobacter sp.]MBE2285012.1 zinc-ribbon domain-containing protein [Prosthecobacter sp.]